MRVTTGSAARSPNRTRLDLCSANGYIHRLPSIAAVRYGGFPGQTV